jgi:aspartate/glutamate racemase
MTGERMLGIVGGVGPESTADYYRRLIDRWRERGPAGSYPSILLDSLNSRPALDALSWQATSTRRSACSRPPSLGSRGRGQGEGRVGWPR